MYLDYFGFTGPPFSLAPDPRYLYLSRRHGDALAHLVFGLGSADGGFVLLTGEVGTGKTTVCRRALEQLPADCDVAFVYNPMLTIIELLTTICDELHVSYQPGTQSVKVLVDRLNARLLESHARGRRTVLIIDEAQNLEPEVMEQLRLLTNLETSERKLLQIILLGQPELLDRLARPELRQLAQRIVARCHLEQLDPGELANYLRHRLAVAGVRRELFPRRVVSRLYRLTGGIPRLVNVVADRALLGAYVEGRNEVSARILERAAREVMGEPRRRDHRREAARGWGVAAAVGLGVAGVLVALNWASILAALDQVAQAAQARLEGTVQPAIIETWQAKRP